MSLTTLNPETVNAKLISLRDQYKTLHNSVSFEEYPESFTVTFLYDTELEKFHIHCQTPIGILRNENELLPSTMPKSTAQIPLSSEDDLKTLTQIVLANLQQIKYTT